MSVRKHLEGNGFLPTLAGDCLPPRPRSHSPCFRKGAPAGRRMLETSFSLTACLIIILLTIAGVVAYPISIDGEDTKCYGRTCLITADLNIPPGFVNNHDLVFESTNDNLLLNSSLVQQNGNNYVYSMLIENTPLSSWKWSLYAYNSNTGDLLGYLDPFVDAHTYVFDLKEYMDVNLSRAIIIEDHAEAQPRLYKLEDWYHNHSEDSTLVFGTRMQEDPIIDYVGESTWSKLGVVTDYHNVIGGAKVMSPSTFTGVYAQSSNPKTTWGNNEPYSFSVWLYLLQGGLTQIPLGNGGAFETYYIRTDNRLKYRNTSGGQVYHDLCPVNLNELHHYYVAYNGTHLQCYVDAIGQGWVDMTNSNGAPFDFRTIGARDTSGNNPFEGLMDELQFFNSVLSEDEISDLYAEQYNILGMNQLAAFDFTNIDNPLNMLMNVSYSNITGTSISTITPNPHNVGGMWMNNDLTYNFKVHQNYSISYWMYNYSTDSHNYYYFVNWSGTEYYYINSSLTTRFETYYDSDAGQVTFTGDALFLNYKIIDRGSIEALGIPTPPNVNSTNYTYWNQRRDLQYVSKPIPVSENISVVRNNLSWSGDGQANLSYTFNTTFIKNAPYNISYWSILNVTTAGYVFQHNVTLPKNNNLSNLTTESYFFGGVSWNMQPSSDLTIKSPRDIILNCSVNNSNIIANLTSRIINASGTYDFLVENNETNQTNISLSYSGYATWRCFMYDIEGVYFQSPTIQITSDLFNPPNVSLVTPPNNTVTNATKVYFAWNVTDNIGLDKGYFYIRSSIDNSLFYGENINFKGNQVYIYNESFNPTGGEYYWGVTANDTRGDNTTKEYNFTRLDPPPHPACLLHVTTDFNELDTHSMPCSVIREAYCSTYNYTLISLNDNSEQQHLLRHITNKYYYANLDLEQGDYLLEFCNSTTYYIKVTSTEDDTRMIAIIIGLIFASLLFFYFAQKSDNPGVKIGAYLLGGVQAILIIGYVYVGSLGGDYSTILEINFYGILGVFSFIFMYIIYSWALHKVTNQDTKFNKKW